MKAFDLIYTIISLGLILLGVIEGTSFFFAPTLFRVGIKTKTIQSMDIKFDRLEVGKEYKTKHARFKRINNNSCLFAYRRTPFEIHTPFSIKGEILQSKSNVVIIWRIPLISTIFTFIWLLLLFGLLIQTIFQSGFFSMNFAHSVLISLLGTVCAWLLYVLSTLTEEKYARLAFSEILFFCLTNK